MKLFQLSRLSLASYVMGCWHGTNDDMVDEIFKVAETKFPGIFEPNPTPKPS